MGANLISTGMDHAGGGAQLPKTISAVASLGSRGYGVASRSPGHRRDAHPDHRFSHDRLSLVCPVGLVGGLRLSFIGRALAAMYGQPSEQDVQSFLDTMVMPTNRGLLRKQPWHR